MAPNSLPSRWRAMLGIAGVATGTSLLLGAEPAAAGVIAATPVGCFNHIVLRWAGGRPSEHLGGAIGFAISVRLVLSVAVVLIAASFGWQAVLGVLVGLTLEVASTALGALWLLRRSAQRSSVGP